MATADTLVAVDLGGTNLRAALGRVDGVLGHRCADAVDATAGPEAIADRIAATVRDLVGAGRRPAGVGVACPGVVDASRGVVVGARNLAGWRDVPLAAMLARRLDAPVRIDNDVNLAALGEAWLGAGRGVRDLVFVGVGTGVGVGIVIEGRVRRGARFAAGEVNPLPSGVAEEGLEIGVEDVASGAAILRRARARGLDVPDSAAVFAVASAGDRTAAAVIQEAVRALARVVAWSASLLDPAVIVIGGGVSAQGEALLSPLRAETARLAPLRAPIVASALGVDAQLYGALRLASEA